MKVTSDRIVAAALDLLNEVGLDGLTTRLLADRLGVQQPALYWHFKSRRALLDAMNDAMLVAGVAADPPPDGQDWQSYVFALGCRFRAALLTWRDGARVHAGTPADRQQYERLLTVLTGAGLPLTVAADLGMAMSRFVVGWVLEEQAEPRPLPEGFHTPGPDGEGLALQSIRAHVEQGETAAFEAGLRFLIDGAALAAKG